MDAVNPYQTPASKLAQADPGEYCKIDPFTSAGRIGRLRYFVYSMVCTLILYGVIGVAAEFLGGDNWLANGLILLAVVIIIPTQLCLTIQRLHDFNASGWWCLVYLMFNFLFLIFVAVRGAQGPNRFGNPPPPNSSAVIAAGCIFLTLLCTAVLFAIIAPEYLVA